MAIGETGLDYHRDRAPRDLQRRAFEAQIELARELGKPLVIHTRSAAEDTIALLRRRAGGLAVILHCFSMPEHIAACVEAGWWISFAGNLTYPKATELAVAATPRLRPRACSSRPTRPTSPRSRAAARRTSRRPWSRPPSFLAGLRGVGRGQSSRSTLERNAAELFGW